MTGGFSIEVVIMLLCAVVGATIWIVTAINGVRDAVQGLSTELRKDIASIDNRVSILEKVREHKQRAYS